MSKTYLYNRSPVPESSPKQNIGIGKQAFLERDDNELTAFEAISEELPDVLCVLQVESGVNLVENVHGSRLEL